MHEASRNSPAPFRGLSDPRRVERAEMICIAAACEAALADPTLEPHIGLVMANPSAWAAWANQNADAAGWWEMQDSKPAAAQALRRYAIATRLTGATVTHATMPLLSSLPPILTGAVA